MKDKEIQAEAHKAFEDLKSGKDKNDLSGVIHDIEDAKSKMTPQEYAQYLKDLNKETATILPKVEIEGTTVQNGKHELMVTDHKHDVHNILDSNEAKRLDAVRPLSEAAEKHEKRGERDVTVNDRGEITSVRAKTGYVFHKGSDGEWIGELPDSGPHDWKMVVKNLTVSPDGTLSYDTWDHEQGTTHYDERTDGTRRVVSHNVYNPGTVIYDPNGYGVPRKPHDDGW